MPRSNPDALARWSAAGLQAFRLPSGFIVSGVWPSMTDLARRGVLPFTLRRAVLEAALKQAGHKPDDPPIEPTQDEVQNNFEQRQRIAAAFVRGLYDDETGEWQALRLTFEELTEGTLPGDDVEALDTFVSMALNGSPDAAALTTNAMSELTLGLIDIRAPEPEPKEAGDTVDGMVDFRDRGRGVAGGAGRADVEHAAIRDAAHRQPADRLPRRRRTGAAPPA